MDFASEIAGGSGKPGRPSDSAARLRMFEARAMRQYLFADPTVRIACIGDVHGRIDLLEKLGRRLEDFVGDETRRLIEIYVGDYIDRAGDPKSVVEFLIARQARTDREVVCLLGNHEYLLLSALRSDDGFLHWLSFGGVSTLLSYGVPSAEVKRNPSNATTIVRSRSVNPYRFPQGCEAARHEHGMADQEIRPCEPHQRQSYAEARPHQEAAKGRFNLLAQTSGTYSRSGARASGAPSRAAFVRSFLSPLAIDFQGRTQRGARALEDRTLTSGRL